MVLIPARTWDGTTRVAVEEVVGILLPLPFFLRNGASFLPYWQPGPVSETPVPLVVAVGYTVVAHYTVAADYIAVADRPPELPVHLDLLHPIQGQKQETD